MKKTICGTAFMIVGAILLAACIISASLNLDSHWFADRLISTIVSSPLLIVVFCLALFHWSKGFIILSKELKNDDIAK